MGSGPTEVDVGVRVGVDQNGNLQAYVEKQSNQAAGQKVSEYDWRQKRGGARANINFHDRLKRTS
jgi:ABC-type lipoprotein release transport system permease subunit